MNRQKKTINLGNNNYEIMKEIIKNNDMKK